MPEIVDLPTGKRIRVWRLDEDVDIPLRRCTKCDRWLMPWNFVKGKPWCEQCRHAYDKAYYARKMKGKRRP